MTEEEYNLCIKINSDALFNFVNKQVRDEAIAKDTVQEAWVRLWEKHKELLFEKGKSFAYTTAYHLIVDGSRKAKVENQYIGNYSGDVVSFNTYSDEKEYLEFMIDLLPKVQKTVLLLRDLEGYNYEEIGKITQLTEAQVKTYIFRARLFLKQNIKR